MRPDGKPEWFNRAEMATVHFVQKLFLAVPEEKKREEEIKDGVQNEAFDKKE